MSGLEELLGAIAGWIGFDLRKMSVTRIIFVVAFWSLLGLVLVFGGIYSLLEHSDDSIGVIGGVLCMMLGLSFLAKIIVNLRAVLGTPTWLMRALRRTPPS